MCESVYVCVGVCVSDNLFLKISSCPKIPVSKFVVRNVYGWMTAGVGVGWQQVLEMDGRSGVGDG